MATPTPKNYRRPYVCAYMSPDQARWANEQAAQRGLTRSGLIRLALANYCGPFPSNGDRNIKDR